MDPALRERGPSLVFAMAVLRIRGPAVPEGEVVDLYCDGDRWTTEPVADAELVARQSGRHRRDFCPGEVTACSLRIEHVGRGRLPC
jgi:hypothetical protein